MSQDSLINLNFKGKQIRMVGTAERPEWVAADVCELLGIARPAHVLRYFADKNKGVCLVDTSGQSREMLTVTEPGLYRLIFKSRKAEAEAFQEFVFHDVLPCIRKHGCYPAPQFATDSNALVSIDPHELMVQMGQTFREAVFQTTEPQFRAVDERFDKVDAKVDQVDNKVDSGFEAMSARIDSVERRKNLAKKTQRQHVGVLTRFNRGMCPCCKERVILTEGGTRLADLQFDHWHRPSMNALHQTWPVCVECNLNLRDHDFKQTRKPYFEAYQQDRKRWEEFMDGPSLFKRQP